MSVLDRVPTTARLWAAAVLALVPLGLVWAQRSGSLTPGIQGPMICDADGNCEPGVFTPGVYVPGATQYGSQTDARVFLLGAAIALIVVAVRVRTATTLRVARLATVSLAIAAALALGQRAILSLICLLLALTLVAPAVFGRKPMPG